MTCGFKPYKHTCFSPSFKVSYFLVSNRYVTKKKRMNDSETKYSQYL